MTLNKGIQNCCVLY